MNALLKVIGFTAFIGLLSLAGKWDAETAEWSERDYCERVSQGVHTNYSNLNCEVTQ